MTKPPYRPFKVGTDAPPTYPDAGSGQWCSEAQTRESVNFHKYLLNHLPSSSIVLGINSAKHMAHFLGNSGKDYIVDLQEFIDKSARLKYLYDVELENAKIFAESLPIGRHSIVAESAGTDEFRQKPNASWRENDLFFASGSYHYWGAGDVEIKKHNDKKNECEITFRFHFYDRYNWDAKKATNLHVSDENQDRSYMMKPGAISDEKFAQLHRQCMAKDFDIKGMIEVKEKFIYEK